MIFRKAIGLIILWGLLLPAYLAGQQVNVRFERLTIEDGLSQNSIHAIAQDRLGFLWFGTEDGLNRYDGYEFKAYKIDPDDPYSITENWIHCLFVDSRGELWIGTWGGGLNYYDQAHDRFIHYQHDPANPHSISDNEVWAVAEDPLGQLWVGSDKGLNRLNRHDGQFTRYMTDDSTANRLSANPINTIAIDRMGTLWIGTDGGGLIQFDPLTETFQQYRNDPANSASLSHDKVWTILIDDDQHIWVGTDRALDRFDPDSETFSHFYHDPENPTSISDTYINSIVRDFAGKLWIGTDTGGLNRFDPETETFHRFRYDPMNPTSLGFDAVTSVYVDRSGILWIGTDGGGLSKYSPKKFYHYKNDPSDPHSLNSNMVYTGLEDDQGRLWIGTSRGISVFDPQTGRFTRFEHDPLNPNGLSDAIVNSVCQDSRGRFWVGTATGGLNRFYPDTQKFKSWQPDPDDPQSLAHKTVRVIREGAGGQLWLATRGGGLDRFDPERETFTHFQHDPDNPQSLSHNRLNALIVDQSGMLWVGTSGGGLNRFDPVTETFTPYTQDAANSKTLSDIYVISLLQARDGTLWAGTYNGGLNKMITTSNGVTFRHYIEKDGLPNNIIYGILEDHHANLWISTNHGLSRFDPVTETFKNFDARDGLQSNEFNTGSCFQRRNGEMIFGGINGITWFHPDSIVGNPIPPPVVLTGFNIFDKAVRFEQTIWQLDRIDLSYKQNFFSFEFAVLDYHNPSKNQYAYMLVGLDPNWIHSGARRFASYTNVDGGDYVFRVKGSNNDGVWNEDGAAISIHIEPPFWQKLWFKVLEILVVIGLVIIGFIWQHRRLERNKEQAIRSIQLQNKIRELEHARSIQISMIPQIPPQLSNLQIAATMQTAREVGGDYYDFIPTPDGKKIFITIADVSGKGVPACLLMVSVRSILNSLIHENLPPDEIIIRINRHIVPDIRKMKNPMMVTMLLLSWDVDNHTLTGTGAGHEYILVYRREFRKVELINPGGVWLGILDEISEHTHTDRIAVQPGDVIVLYTDGITEYKNPIEGMFGLEKLVDFIEQHGHNAPADIIAQLLVELENFGQDSGQYDDVTIVVLKVI